jgi:thiol-disulfide isomerase/thioredoxin
VAEPPSTTQPLLVACLCAAWCRSCDAYRPIFDGLAQRHAGIARFFWLDVEDDAERLGDLDIATFPTLLIGQADRVSFFGPVLPNAAAAQRLIVRAGVASSSGPLTQELSALLQSLALQR